ncbi:hypothetical protein RB595_007050 [Gaeumannomyces hyphopodioides]
MAENGRMAGTVRSVQLEMEPACVGFCPEAPEHFVMGAWHLVEDKPDPSSHTDDASPATKKQKHEGSIEVYRLTGYEITKIQTEAHPTCAIWDLEFQPHAGRRDVFAAGTSAGTVLVYRLAAADSPEAPLRRLLTIGPISADDDEVMITKCCWHPAIRDLLAFSTLAGDVHLARLEETGDGGFAVATVTRTAVLTHTEPAWTVALGPAAPALAVYSGGDDSALRYVACAPDEGGQDGGPFANVYDAVAMQRGPHEAGVVSILPLGITLGSGHDVVVTGSYDDRVRVLAVLPPQLTCGAPQYRVLAESHVGGGAWRLRLVSFIVSGGGDDGTRAWRARLLAPCMSAGSRVLEVRGVDGLGGWEVEALGGWVEVGEGDRMLNYGADFQPGTSTAGGEDGPLTCVSTSFYSKMLYLWRF